MQLVGRNTLLGSIFELAELYGAGRDGILREIGIDAALANTPGAFVDSAKLIDAVEYAAIATGRADFGLQLGMRQDHRSLGPVGVLIEHCRSVAEAVAEGSRYLHLHLHNSALLYTLTPSRERYLLRLQLGTRGRYPPRHYVEALLTMGVRFCRVMLGPQWQPLSVHLEHEQSAPRAAYQRAFGCGVAFGSEMNGLVASRADFETRITPADPRIKALVQRLLDDLEREHAQNMPGKVATLLRPLLPSGRATAATVAELMSLSPRTFQRRLAAHGKSFLQIVTETRVQLVSDYLSRDGMTATAMAPILGFSEASSVSRFLREHVGHSARELKVRRQAKTKNAAARDAEGEMRRSEEALATVRLTKAMV